MNHVLMTGMARCCCKHIKVVFKILGDVASQQRVVQDGLLSCQVDGGDTSNLTLEFEHECQVQGCIYHVGAKSFAEMVNLALQLGWMGQTPFNVSLMIWKSVKEGLK